MLFINVKIINTLITVCENQIIDHWKSINYTIDDIEQFFISITNFIFLFRLCYK